MWLLILSLSAVVLASEAACPAGWSQAGSPAVCYGLLTPSQAYNSTYTARQACLQEGADLVRLKDVEAHQNVGTLLQSISGPPSIYIGVHYGTGAFKYLSSADAVSYTKSLTGIATGNCISMVTSDWTDTTKGEWKRIPCCKDSGIKHVVCEKPFSSSTTVPQANDQLHQECFGSNDACSSNPCQNGGTCENDLPLNSTFTCKCDAGKTGLTCETDLTCPTVTTTTYSNANYNPPGSSSPGTTFDVTCKTDFKFPDRTTTKTMECDSSGQWSPNVKGCTKHCPAAPAVVNADVDNPGTAIGHVMNYTCITGYKFPDNSTYLTVTCETDGKWSIAEKDLPQCDIVVCPALPVFSHQSLNTRNTTYNTTIIFWCDVGYALSDNTTARTIKCTETGDWSAQLPPCLPIKCPYIHPIAKGTRNSSENVFETFVEYRCQSGYRMEDGAAWRIIKCDATGEWSDDVTDCDLNRCYPLPYVANATPSTLEARMNTEVTFTCIKGHKFYLPPSSKADSQKIICKSDSGRLRWDPSLRGCEPVQCPILKDSIAAQNLKNLAPSSTAILYGSVVNIQCHKGHYKSDNTSTEVVECLSTEQWNVTTYEECEPVKCIQPPAMDDGTESRDLYGKTAFIYQDKVYYACKADYKFLDGQTTRHISCNEFGHWNESDLSCRKDRCDPVPRKADVKPNTTDTNWYTVVKYTCQDGFEWTDGTKQTIVKCTNTGQWENKEALKDCSAKKCPALPTQANSTHNGTRTGTDSYIFGDYVEFTCDRGFKYMKDDVKSKVINCNAQGKWEPATLEPCEPIVCGELDQIENATLQTNDTHFGIDIVYKCNDGYQFPDKDVQKTVRCEAGENDTVGYYEWFKFKTQDPKKMANHCEVVFCPPVPAWSEMDFNSTINEFEAVVSYWCKTGYQFETCDVDKSSYASCQAARALIWEETETVEMTTAVTNDSTEGGAKTRIVERSQSTCVEAKVWKPAFLDCVSIKSISADVKGVVTESKDGAKFGIFAISLLVVTAVTLILLDLNKLFSDCKLMRSNVKYFMDKRKKNKVSDSSVSIPESTA